MKLLRDRLGAAAQGKPVGPNVDKTTFEHLAQILLDDYRANGRRSLERVEATITHLRGFFGDYLAIDITSDQVTRYITWRQKQDAAPTIDREVAALRPTVFRRS